jgi:hypothetical protein
MRITILGVCFACLIAAGCGGGRPDGPPPGHREEEWHAPVQMLLKYAGPDGRLTRTQMETGLRRDFDAADKNHSGVLEPDEARAVNRARWDEDKSAISPLQDWNGDGVIDFSEFAAAARALFNEIDQKHTGILTVNEMRAARGLGPEPTAKDGQPGQGSEPGGDRRGGHPGGGRGGPPGGGG